MRTGIVKQFNHDQSFGFIEDDLTHANYFVFKTAIQTPGVTRLEPGQAVAYQLAEGKKGLQCVNVYLQEQGEHHGSQRNRNF